MAAAALDEFSLLRDSAIKHVFLKENVQRSQQLSYAAKNLCFPIYHIV